MKACRGIEHVKLARQFIDCFLKEEIGKPQQQERDYPSGTIIIEWIRNYERQPKINGLANDTRIERSVGKIEEAKGNVCNEDSGNNYQYPTDEELLEFDLITKSSHIKVIGIIQARVLPFQTGRIVFESKLSQFIRVYNY